MKQLVQIALDWSIRSFGRAHVQDKKVRALRLAEEAIEFCQARDVPIEQMRLLIDTVYGRPVGDANQEIGGVFMTAVIAAAIEGLDPEECFLIELRRVLAKSPEHFRKRNQDKLDLGLTG
jgi:hypothetical protein